MKKRSNLIAFSDGCCFDSMIEDSVVSPVNEAFGVDGHPFGVGKADGVHVLGQIGLFFQLKQGNIRFRYDEGTSDPDNLDGRNKNHVHIDYTNKSIVNIRHRSCYTYQKCR